jgi:phosphoglycerate dehydrogenase-like enzyme
MPSLFVSQGVARRHAAELARLSAQCREGSLQVLTLPGEGTLDDGDLATLDAAFVSTDMLAGEGGEIRRFLGAVRRAPALRWCHIGWAGTDTPVIQEMMDRGVAISNSSGVTSEPIALTVIGGMLALHRGFPRWFEAQRRHSWEVLARDAAPPDLRGQTMIVLGLGAIGTYVARFARALGLHVIGVRRRPAGPEDEVDEWAAPERLHDVLPRCNWLAITIPLTAATRGLIGAREIALLPPGAHILNVARGAVIDEEAMIEALRSGQLGGAYLDVFATEPLPPESPIWDLPNVIVSPHDSSPSQGNNARAEAIFLEELAHWVRGEPLSREVKER